MAPTATVSTASATQRLAGARRPSASRRARCVGVVAALPPNLRHRLFCRPHPSLSPLLKFNTTRAPRIRSGSTRVTATVADVATQNVYTFGKGKGQGDASMKALLGGKGANLAEMCAIGLSVPPGMTITTETCAAFHANGSKLPEGVWEEVLAGLAEVETEMGTKLGDAANPLLLSVRSGAAVSMPGMMDTVLNLGLNDTVVEGLAAKAGERFAYDSYRRFLDMFGAVVMGLPHEAFETELESLKASRGVSEDTDLSSDDLRELVELYKGVYSARGVAFPQEPLEQLRAGIYAVFDSWMSERANVYRRINGITGLKGTAVNVQAMAYGNLGDTSGTGVCFTRNPSTGEAVLYGEYLINAQGEDVVAGIRTPEPIARLAADLPEAYAELVANCNLLEAHYKDMQDIEFTVQEGRLFMLQCRSGKRTGAGAVRIAVDMVAEGLVTREEAVCMVEPTHVDQLLHPRFEDEAAYQADVIGKGLPASPGATTGVVVFRAEDAESMHAAGQDAILVRTETSPEDVGGMWAAAGVLTARGGMTSHAAVVARGWGKTCVSGCGELSVDETARTASLGGVTIREGDWLSLNGSTGEVIAGKQPMRPAELSAELAQLMEWADASRTMSVLTNADTPDDAAAARANGAEGIGLVRTEHMFFATDERLSAVRRMILAQTDAARAEALESLLPFQQADFEGIFTAMDGLPVTIRLLDPPLHEFLPHGEEEEVVSQLAEEAGMDAAEVEETIFRLAEVNPMLGFRGCRLAITYPEIGAMQVRAILQAACAVQKAGVVVRPDIMVPLVGTPEELAMQEAMVREVADTVTAEQGETVNYRVGTMIEVPRACLVADDIAAHAEFFSFGTNDLTQMTYGYSRDDVNKFLPIYLDKGILPVDPFQSLDQKGVGQLIEMATTKGRSARRDLKVGICGEQGGDPASVEFVHRVGLDYVSCSPFRVPIARLAAAQAAIKHGRPSKQ